MPSITNLANSTVLTVVENKMPGYTKYITTPKFSQLKAENFTARFKQGNLATKADIADFIKNTDFDDKLKNLNKNVT